MEEYVTVADLHLRDPTEDPEPVRVHQRVTQRMEGGAGGGTQSATGSTTLTATRWTKSCAHAVAHTHSVIQRGGKGPEERGRRLIYATKALSTHFPNRLSLSHTITLTEREREREREEAPDSSPETREQHTHAHIVPPQSAGGAANTMSPSVERIVGLEGKRAGGKAWRKGLGGRKGGTEGLRGEGGGKERSRLYLKVRAILCK